VPILATQIGSIFIQGLYSSGQKRRDYCSLIETLTFAHILLLLVAFFYQPNEFISRSTFIYSWLLSISFVLVSRLGFNTVVARFRRKGTALYPTFLVCKPEDREKAIKLILRENCYNLLGWGDIASQNDSESSWNDTIEYICSLNVSDVFICSWESLTNRMILYWKLRNAGIVLHILPTGLADCYQKSELRIIGGLPYIHLSPPLITGIDFWLKRCFDVCCATLLLIIAAPLYLAIALLIKLDSPGSVFYRQTRIGLHGRPFQLWKFRTMIQNAEGLQKSLERNNETKDGILFKIKNDPRVTPIGRVLRRYSLDELPQLFNVILGEMSLVGPRPLPVRDVEKFAEHHFIRHRVMPGITGLWQVSGRSDITDFEEVLQLDITYIENWSLALDWQILLQTIWVIFTRTGAY
jgi:exopolysaccharide biosynthesis polyprenyl glycosylphosphotransferase